METNNFVILYVHYTGKMIKNKDGKEFESKYYYFLLPNGRKVLVNPVDSKDYVYFSLFAINDKNVQ